MPEGIKEPHLYVSEHGENPGYNEEIVQYNDGQLAIRVTGGDGALFEFDMHKWSPTKPMGEGIISTNSGNNYYMFTDAEEGKTWVLNTRETEGIGKPVAAYGKKYPMQLPALEFGKPWRLPGFCTTTDVKSLLIKYKLSPSGLHGFGRKIDTPNPFNNYKALLR